MTTPPPDPLDPLRAALAGRYDIERELGAGGMAVVYLARDVQRDRPVALKVLRPGLGLAAGAERFHREIRLAARLVHPHILPLLDSGEAGGRLWYTMPYIEGESLRARMDREKLLPVDEAIRISCEVAEALGCAHAQGILHRDIKPENILLSGGQPLVADFGIARAIGSKDERITGTGIAIGTPAYMSPEQASGEADLDARSDLYALACVTYEMLAGEPPFVGPTAQVMIARRLSQPPPSVRTIRPQVPEALDAVLHRALAPIPADRFATAAEFARALSGVLTSSFVAPPAPRRKRRWPTVAGGAALLVVAAGGLWLAGRPPRAPGPDNAPAGLRLAVLPFRLISRDSADLYLAAGVTAEVTSALSNLAGLRVIARTSVLPYGGSPRSAREIGTALGADALVEGDVQKAGDLVRIRVQLIDVPTEESRWSQEYDHSSQDIFRIQSEVASRIAGVLRIQLAERESRSLQRPPTTNPQAYDHYLRGRALPDDRSNLDSAITEFTRAVQLDSTFASAWARLADADISAVFLYDADPRRLERADAAIRRALALDSTSAMAWKARSDLQWNAVRGWHFPEALADVRHALTLDPSMVEAHNALGSLYFHYGFMEEARRELDTSLSLDPRDGCDNPTRCVGFSRPRVARVQWYRQQFDSALATYRKIPYLGGFVWELAVVLNGLGRPAEGLALLDTAQVAGMPVRTTDAEAARALLLATLGRDEEAEAQIRSALALRESRSHFHHAQFTIACTYARLGRTADAVEWLRQTAANGMPNYPLFRNDPNLRALQGVPEYEALLAGLKQQFEAYGRLVRAAE